MNEPRFEVYPQMSAETAHPTYAYDRTAYHPSGDEYTVAEAHCDAEGCEWTANGDPADVRDAAAAHENENLDPTGEFAGASAPPTARSAPSPERASRGERTRIGRYSISSTPSMRCKTMLGAASVRR